MKGPSLAFWGAVALVTASGGLALYGQPDVAQKWQFLAPEYQPKLDRREVYIDPAELLKLMQDDYLDLWIIDVRPESDWNLFHLQDAERIPIEALPAYKARLADLPFNGVVVLVGNDELLATRAWQHLMVLARPNAYILEGGLNHWLNIYGRPEDELHGNALADLTRPDGTLRHPFRLALGARHPAALPDPQHAPDRSYTPKVKLQRKIVRKQGCG